MNSGAFTATWKNQTFSNPNKTTNQKKTKRLENSGEMFTVATIHRLKSVSEVKIFSVPVNKPCSSGISDLHICN